MLITTRMPTKFQAEADVKGFTQHFNLFGVNGNFNGSETSASIGDKIGNFSYLLDVNHLETPASRCSSGRSPNRVRRPKPATFP